MNNIHSSDFTVGSILIEIQAEIEKWNIDAYHKTFMDLKSYGQSVFDENTARKVYAAYNALMHYNCHERYTEKCILIRHELERLKTRLFWQDDN